MSRVVPIIYFGCLFDLAIFAEKQIFHSGHSDAHERVKGSLKAPVKFWIQKFLLSQNLKVKVNQISCQFYTVGD